MPMARLDRKEIRAILEFQVSWVPQGTLGHREQMEVRELLDHQESKDPQAKKVLPAPQAPLDYLEPREKKAKKAEMENQEPPESRAKQESRVCQDRRAPKVPQASRDTPATLAPLAPGESLVPWGPLAGKGPQEKTETQEPQGRRAPRDPGAYRARTDRLDLRETPALQEAPVRREPEEKTAAQDSLASWVPVGLRESQARREAPARREPLGSLESRDPEEKGEIRASKVTRDLLEGRASLGTLASQATKVTQA